MLRHSPYTFQTPAPVTIPVNPRKLEEITIRVEAACAMLELIHSTLKAAPAADALYGVLFVIGHTVEDLDALITGPATERTEGGAEK